MSSVSYVIISPVRDEGEYIEKTINSMLLQTIKPMEWIIVNDGSSDNTGEIIDEYASKHPWIKTVHRENRGFRKAGGGVIETFYDGYQNISSSNWQFVVKLDGDLSFEPDYFEQCFKKFSKDKKVGIAGGDIYNIINGEMVHEKTPSFHVRGATKIYKNECWDDIGGLIQAPGWDTLDEVKASMKGWTTRSFSDLKVSHHRVTGAADGTWRNWVKNGQGSYIVGYHPLFMLAKCAKKSIQKPYVITAAGLLYGFFGGYLRRTPQIKDKELIKYLREQQLRKLMHRETIWK